MKLIEDLKKLKYGAYALLLVVTEYSLYYLMNPELTFTIDEKLNEYNDLLPACDENYQPWNMFRQAAFRTIRASAPERIRLR